jgi:hypothetical protein
VAFPGDDELEASKLDTGARSEVKLPPADDEMTVGRRRGSVAILDLARLVSSDAQTPPTWRTNCRCRK